MKRYILLNVGEKVKDGDEEYDFVEWRPVSVEFIGEAIQEIDPPVRRIEIRTTKRGAKKS